MCGVSLELIEGQEKHRALNWAYILLTFFLHNDKTFQLSHFHFKYKCLFPFPFSLKHLRFIYAPSMIFSVSFCRTGSLNFFFFLSMRRLSIIVLCQNKDSKKINAFQVSKYTRNVPVAHDDYIWVCWKDTPELTVTIFWFTLKMPRYIFSISRSYSTDWMKAG